MKNNFIPIVVLVFSLFLTVTSANAIEGLQVKVQGTNALVSWSSVETETFIVQYRSKLDATMPWVILTNGLTAASGTNHTSFLHSGIVEYGTATGGGSGELPPNPLQQVTQIETIGGQSSMTPETSINKSLDSAELLTPIDLPPLPWDPHAVQTDALSALSLQSLDAPESPQGCIGFYRVVRQGLYVVGFSNQMMLSSSVAFPMEIGCADKTITGVSAYVNDQPLIGGSIACNENNQWIFEWDTTCMPNGNYSVYFEAYFVGGGSVSNAPISVTISNAVAFPDYFSRFYGDTLFVYAALTTPEAHFVLTMKDAQGNPICYFEDDTYDGTISFSWDLTDGNGYTFTNDVFYGEFEITPLSGQSQVVMSSNSSRTNATFNWVRERAWSSDAGFVVAYAAKVSTPDGVFNMRINDMVAQGVVDMLWNIYTLSPGNSPNSKTAFFLSDTNARENLLSYLEDSAYRNFYFCGHGNPNAIGGVDNTTLIDAKLLRLTLKNYLSAKVPTNSHPYTFVFLDTCSAGKGNLCETFGIPCISVEASYFQAANMRSRAFLGFKKDTMTEKAAVENRATMLAQFFYDWVQGLDLQTCVTRATQFTPTGARLNSSWVIYGATNLSFNTF